MLDVALVTDDDPGCWGSGCGQMRKGMSLTKNTCLAIEPTTESCG